MQRFTLEITELRSLGFAEGLSIEPPRHAGGIVARLESGRIGVAVEFRAGEGIPTYAVIPLVADGGRAHTVATDAWGDVLRDIHRRAPPDENE
ncbi:MAG TPA: hypothetical protein VJO99_19295 [Burkholderiaceae bacterium]|nr:hypothetical protein [Burkholderiaceae bacterium]